MKACPSINSVPSLRARFRLPSSAWRAVSVESHSDAVGSGMAESSSNSATERDTFALRLSVGHEASRLGAGSGKPTYPPSFSLYEHGKRSLPAVVTPTSKKAVSANSLVASDALWVRSGFPSTW